MTQTRDAIIPCSLIVSRLEKHHEYFLSERDKLPWWAFKRRYCYASAAAVYEYEIDAILLLGASVQPIIGSKREEI